jgi:CubicO group peptidase (beta-lactamase class C family)
VDAIGAFAFDSERRTERKTLFRIASLTKPIVAAAAMMLVEDGTLALDAPVERWLPELANRRVLERIDGPLDDTVPAVRPIIVEDLLTLKMGYGIIVEPTFDPPFPINVAANELQLTLAQPDPRTPHAPDEWMKRFASLPLMYQPRERWMYNVGSLVLGVLVARAAKQSLGDVLHERVFEPLGMRETGFSTSTENINQIPAYYMTNFQTGKLERLPLSPPEEWTTPPAFPSGAGGLLSTIDDYLAFARMMLQRGVFNGVRVLSERSVALMTTNHLTPEQIAGGGPILHGQGWGYGLGVTVAPDEASDTPGRYGWAGGYGTVWFNDPQRKLMAIALTQTSDFLWSGALAEFEKLALAS